MKNKTCVAAPVTEELLKTLYDDEYYAFIIKGTNQKQFHLGAFIKGVPFEHAEKAYGFVILEQPLSLSVTAEGKISNENILEMHLGALDFIELKEKDYLKPIIRAMNESNSRACLEYAQLQNKASLPSDEEIEKAASEHEKAESYGYSDSINGMYRNIDFVAGVKWLLSYKEESKKEGWISVKERPLFTKDEKGYWACTEDGDNDFIAAVPYSDSTKPGEEMWWIRHCVVEDGVGLCVVGDDCNEPAGWDLEQVTHWMPLPEQPKEEGEK